MTISPKTNQYLHHKLPIDDDENILGVYRHHWFTYVSSCLFALIVVVVVMVLAALLTTIGDGTNPLVAHRAEVLALAGCFSILVLAGAFVPVYLRLQEQMVLTEEAILQVLQPSLFASKIDQLGLQNIANVSVTQDFFGTLLGYGHITIETPGEQDNYEFAILPSPQQTAREIMQAHENYEAALQGGHMPTTLGTTQNTVEGPQIDPEQYRQFLEYQQMVARQQQENASVQGSPKDDTSQK